MILGILSIIAGIVFITTGIYFLSDKFLQKINDASANLTDEYKRRNFFRAKGTAYVSLAIGALTLVFGIMLLLFPSVSAGLAIFYLFVLILGFGTLIFIYR